MALRKEEFDYDPHAKKAMEHAQSAQRQHLIIDISAELIKRIQEAARQQQLTVDQYVENLLSEAIPAQDATSQEGKPVSREGVEQLFKFQDQLLAERGGIPFENILELLYESREERDRELGIE